MKHYVFLGVLPFAHFCCWDCAFKKLAFADLHRERYRCFFLDVSVLDGRFKISGDVLSLFAENTPATQFKLEVDENGRILFQGVAFSRM